MTQVSQTEVHRRESSGEFYALWSSSTVSGSDEIVSWFDPRERELVGLLRYADGIAPIAGSGFSDGQLRGVTYPVVAWAGEIAIGRRRWRDNALRAQETFDDAGVDRLSRFGQHLDRMHGVELGDLVGGRLKIRLDWGSREELCKRLAEAGERFNVAVADQFDDQPLWQAKPSRLTEAILADDAEFVVDLLATDPDGHVDGLTPLLRAACELSAQTVVALVRAGSDVNMSQPSAQLHEPLTELLLGLLQAQRAISEPELEAVKVLVESGAMSGDSELVREAIHSPALSAIAGWLEQIGDEPS